MKPVVSKSPGEFPKEWLVCRAFGHDWNFVTDRTTTGTRKVLVEFWQEKQCEVCRTVRETLYELPSLRPKKRKYWHPDGYKVKGGFPVVDARAEYVTAVLRVKMPEAS